MYRRARLVRDGAPFLKRPAAAAESSYQYEPSRPAGPHGERPEREVAEDDSTAGTWSEFHRRIEVRGDSERALFDEELDNWLGRLSEEERESLAQKLESMRFEVVFARGMVSVLEDAFSLVAAMRWQLRQDSARSDRWRREAAFHLYQFAEALRRAIAAAGEVEKSTGYSGRELAEEAAS